MQFKGRHNSNVNGRHKGGEKKLYCVILLTTNKTILDKTTFSPTVYSRPRVKTSLPITTLIMMLYTCQIYIYIYYVYIFPKTKYIWCPEQRKFKEAKRWVGNAGPCTIFLNAALIESCKHKIWTCLNLPRLWWNRQLHIKL